MISITSERTYYFLACLAITLIVGLTGCSKSNNNPITPAVKPALVTTLAGNGTYGSGNGTGATATFAYPDAICTDASGNIYVGDGGDFLIRKITPDGVVSTVKGGLIDTNKYSGGVPGIWGLTIDPSGTFYFTRSLGSILYKLSPEGVTSLVAGSQMGDKEGQGSAAEFNGLFGIASDGNGNIYVADDGNYKIRKITPSGITSTVTGTGIITSPGSSSSVFLSLQDIALDKSGNFYVTDPAFMSVTKFSPAGVSKHIASMNGPAGIAVDAAGNVYVSDMKDHIIKKIAADGTVSLIAGTGKRGYADGPGDKASFALPQSIALDPTGKILYVADAGNSVIRKIVLP